MYYCPQQLSIPLPLHLLILLNESNSPTGVRSELVSPTSRHSTALLPSPSQLPASSNTVLFKAINSLNRCTFNLHILVGSFKRHKIKVLQVNGPMAGIVGGLGIDEMMEVGV
jgi:hypothetical protein